MDLVTVRPSNAMTISDGIAVSGTKQQLCLYTGLPRACRDKGREEQRKKQYGFGIQKLHPDTLPNNGGKRQVLHSVGHYLVLE